MNDADAFIRDLDKFAQKRLDLQPKKIVVGVAETVKVHLQEGSLVTGAPGSPVDKGDLKGDWHVDYHQPSAPVVYNTMPYAPDIEHGFSPKRGTLQLRSKVGGFHSRKMILMNAQRLVDWVVQNLR